MKTGNTSHQGTPPSRRGFLRGGLRGLAWFGLGNALGWFSPRARARGAEPAGRGGSEASLGKAFEYDVSKFRKTDPRLLLFEPAGEVQSGFKELRAIAVATDDRLVAGGDQALRVFDAGGGLLKEIPLGAAPRCVALAPDGTVLAGLKDSVLVLSADGSRRASWTTLPAGAVITSIAASAGDVFVADAGNRVIWRLDHEGKVVKEIGRKNKERRVPGFVVPSPYFDIALGTDGLLWAANPGQLRVEAYTLDGAFELGWGEATMGVTGFGGCCNPVHFVFLPDGRVVTSEKGIARVKVYSALGKFEGVVAGPESFAKYFENPNATHIGIDVATDSKGRVLLADSLSGTIRIFAPKK